MRTASVLLAFALAAGACSSSSNGSHPSPTVAASLTPAQAGPSRSGLPRFSRIAVIVMENKDYGQVIGFPRAPYENSLALSYGLATRFYAITHGSLANYLALVGGDTYGVTQNCYTCHFPGPTLADQLESAGISWKAYMEDMPSPCFDGATTALYAKKHNPFAYIDTITSSPSKCSKVVPLTEFEADLNANRLPSFVWITPNLCNDQHNCKVSDGDRFLAGFVPKLLPALGPTGILFLTWDEGNTNEGCCQVAAGGHIVTILAGPAARKAESSKQYTLYSILRTIEDAWGLPLLGAAGCTCTMPMTDLIRPGS